QVIADFAKRREMVRAQLDAAAGSRQWLKDEALVDEVTALVEFPAVYEAGFEAEFLAVPQECLILTMKANQKYFPLFEAGKLTNRFLVVSNMKVADPANIIGGNARVVRPRLADAKFFYETDRKTPLINRVEKLSRVVYHNKLGSQFQRVERMQGIARKIALALHADAEMSARAALLAKADLTSDMVGEFPELQGIMGRYYALNDGEPAEVADAIEAHYKPRYAGDTLPQGNIACAVALAEKLDSLAGFFSIGQIPTGDKDPFGLRRAALGVLRILMETPLPLPLDQLIAMAAELNGGSAESQTQLFDFMQERLRGLLRDLGHEQNAVEAVLALQPKRIDLVPLKLDAVRAFRALPEAEALAAANKRIVNILKKNEAAGVGTEVDFSLLQEAAEKTLFEKVTAITPQIRSLVGGEDYAAALTALAGLRDAVDAFFDNVMVMAEEPLTRQNRLALLGQLKGLMNQVADISRL
ncbi:MAG: glycine--tRNA ligase subunit beta, partial [Nevskiales bacterium]